MSGPDVPSRDQDRSAIGSAHWILRVRDLAANLEFFQNRLGFRLESILPAEEPRQATLRGHGLLLGLRQDDCDDAPTLRLTLRDGVIAAPNGSLRAPNGSRVEFVEAQPRIILPDNAPAFVLSRLDGSASWTEGRAGMRYRDLIGGRQGGRFIASHIQITQPGPVADYVHYHHIHFQLIYCRKGWVRLVYEAQGEPFVMRAGDCVLQPPQIRHRVLESGDGLEVIEVTCPAEHETHAEHELTLPSAGVDPDRTFGGQRFVLHRAQDASWGRWHQEGFECRDLELADASAGRVSARVVRRRGPGAPQAVAHDGELLLLFVLAGSVRLDTAASGSYRLGEGDCVTLPAGECHRLDDGDASLEFLEVRAAADAPVAPCDETSLA